MQPFPWAYPILGEPRISMLSCCSLFFNFMSCSMLLVRYKDRLVMIFIVYIVLWYYFTCSQYSNMLSEQVVMLYLLRYLFFIFYFQETYVHDFTCDFHFFYGFVTLSIIPIWHFFRCRIYSTYLNFFFKTLNLVEKCLM